MSLKEVLVSPVLKKPLLDQPQDSIILDNFCTVANIPILGTFVEKMIVQKFKMILIKIGYLALFRPGYGTEITLVTLLDYL